MIKDMRYARYVAAVLSLAAVYFAVGRLGLMLDAVAGFATLVWPPTGIALSALLLGTTRLWPGVAIGAFIVNLSVGASPFVALGIACGNTLEAVLAAMALRAIPGFRSALDRLRDVLALIVTAGVITPTVAATVGVVALVGGGVVTSADTWATWRAWWLGDSLGVLVIAPLVLVWATRARPVRKRFARWVELPLLVLVLLAVTVVVYGPPISLIAPFQQSFVIYPVLVWAALRFGQHGATAVILSASLITIVGTVLGEGPFARATLSESLLHVQTFMGVTAVTILLLGAAVCERRRALETQEEFLAVVSHDLRSPLNAIQMNAAAIRDNLESQGIEEVAVERTRRRAESILRSVQRMDSLIIDLLDLGAMSKGALRVEPQPVDACPLFEDVIAQLLPLAEQKRQSLTLEPIPEGLRLLADRQRLAQALINLVSNAVKFTPTEGRVSVSVVRSNGSVVVSVRDTGPGLQPSELPYLFEPYWQGRRRSQGVGLGLAIARAIVEAHRGRIWAEGNAGGSEAGSTFAFTMPVAQAPGEGSSVSDAASGIPLRARLGSRP